VKKFRYLGDGLFLLIKPHVHHGFMHDHFDDVLLLPCALPPLLLAQRWLKLRLSDLPPSAGEIALYWALWTVQCKILGPHITHRATWDPWDILAYAAGGVLAWCWWHREQIFRRRLIHEL
jgi:hypothetical protein